MNARLPVVPIRESGAQLQQHLVILREDVTFARPTTRIDDFVKIEGRVLFEENVHIASFCHIGIGGGVTIFEDGTSAGSGCRVISGSNVPGIGHGCSASDPKGVIRRSFVLVRENAVLFCGVTVLPGVIIGRNAVIAAGSVVNCDVPDGEVWGGTPARFLRRVDGLTPRQVTPPHDALDPHLDADRWVEALGDFYGWD